MLTCDIIITASVVLSVFLLKHWALRGLYVVVLFTHMHASKYVSIAGLFFVTNVGERYSTEKYFCFLLFF